MDIGASTGSWWWQWGVTVAVVEIGLLWVYEGGWVLFWLVVAVPLGFGFGFCLGVW